MGYLSRPYVYKVNTIQPQPNKILCVWNKNILMELCNKYQTIIIPNIILGIDWSKFKQDFGGIDFKIYDKFRFTDDISDEIYMWYTTIDIPSGCIWQKFD